MVLAAPGSLLTPPPSSFPPKTPFWSYSAQIRSQNEEKIQLPIAEQIFFHVVNKKHRWESLTAESRQFLDNNSRQMHLCRPPWYQSLQTTRRLPGRPRGVRQQVTFGTATSRGPGAHDDDVFYLFLQKHKIGAKLHIYL